MAWVIINEKGRAMILIGDMVISRLMVYVQQVEEKKLRDREEYKYKKAMTKNKFVQQKCSMNRTFFHKKNRHVPSYASAPAP